MLRVWSLLVAVGVPMLTAGCFGKDDDEEEEDATVYSGPCPQVDLGSRVGDGLAEGSTDGADNDWGECGSSPSDGDSGWSEGGSGDVSLKWVAPDSGVYSAYTKGSRFDTILTMIEGSCSGPVIDCDDDGGLDLDSMIRFEAAAGETYIFVLDGFDSGEDGDWEFSVVEGVPSWAGSDSGWGWEDDESVSGASCASAVVGSDRPEVQTWFGPTGVSVSVNGGPGGWWLGVAHTTNTASPGAGIADCMDGGLSADGTHHQTCTPLSTGLNRLTYGADPARMSAGSTLLQPSDEGRVTWMLESDPARGGDGRCFVWGHDVSWFQKLNCVEL